LLLILLSVEAISDVLFSSLADSFLSLDLMDVEIFSAAWGEDVFNGRAIPPFDFAVSNELLVSVGTDALDWLAGVRPSVTFGWLLGSPKELRLVAASVTLNISDADLDPWVALTI
jgi:hypothetical protein